MSELVDHLRRLATLLESLALSLRQYVKSETQIELALFDDISTLQLSVANDIPAGKGIRELHWRSRHKIEAIARDVGDVNARTRLIAEAFGRGGKGETDADQGRRSMLILAQVSADILFQDAARMRTYSSYFARHDRPSAAYDLTTSAQATSGQAAGKFDVMSFGVAVSSATPTTRLATLVPVMFATDRRAKVSSESNFVHFDDGRGQDKLSFGVAEVSIPPGHKMGRMERPVLWKFQFHEDIERHITVTTCNLKDEDEWKRIAEDRLKGASRRQALIFIHGFNVSFDESIRRAAQIGFDLQFDGVIAAYSWCSEGRAQLYLADEDNVILTTPHLLRFLLLLREEMKIDVVHVIAHSMGSRALLGAIADFPSVPEPLKRGCVCGTGY